MALENLANQAMPCSIHPFRLHLHIASELSYSQIAKSNALIRLRGCAGYLYHRCAHAAKPGCPACDEAHARTIIFSYVLKFWILKVWLFTFLGERITKTLISLCGCTGWFAPSLIESTKHRFKQSVAHMNPSRDKTFFGFGYFWVTLDPVCLRIFKN